MHTDGTGRASLVFIPNEHPRGCLVCISLYELLPRTSLLCMPVVHV